MDGIMRAACCASHATFASAIFERGGGSNGRPAGDRSGCASEDADGDGRSLASATESSPAGVTQRYTNASCSAHGVLWVLALGYSEY